MACWPSLLLPTSLRQTSRQMGPWLPTRRAAAAAAGAAAILLPPPLLVCCCCSVAAAAAATAAVRSLSVFWPPSAMPFAVCHLPRLHTACIPSSTACCTRLRTGHSYYTRAHTQVVPQPAAVAAARFCVGRAAARMFETRSPSIYGCPGCMIPAQLFSFCPPSFILSFACVWHCQFTAARCCFCTSLSHTSLPLFCQLRHCANCAFGCPHRCGRRPAAPTARC
jgi:hypothetical protein